MRGLAPLLIAVGLIISFVGLIAVAQAFLPPDFGDRDWLMNAIAQALDALPRPTLGLALLAIGIRAGGSSRGWARGMATVLGVIGLLCLMAPVIALRTPRRGGRGGRARAGMSAGHNQPSRPSVAPVIPTDSATRARAAAPSRAVAADSTPVARRPDPLLVIPAPPRPSRNKISILGAAYGLAYAFMAFTMWRGRPGNHSG